MSKIIQLPITVQFVVNRVNGKLVVLDTTLKFSCKLEEYPDLPDTRLVGKPKLTQEELMAAHMLCRAILKNYLKVEEV